MGMRPSEAKKCGIFRSLFYRSKVKLYCDAIDGYENMIIRHDIIFEHTGT